MALRSVVVAPPPGAAGPRRTVVLRPGGPKDKGKAGDVVIGAIGALLLLLSVFLVQYLPDKEYALPQFSVTFLEPPAIENPTQNFTFAKTEDARTHEFQYEFPDNVHSITMVLYFADENMPASLPDQFRVELFDPLGTPVGPRTDVVSGPPRFNQGTNEYDPGVITSPRLSIPLGLLPEDQIVQGLSHLEVAEQVQARLAPQYHLPTAGLWTVRVTMVNAGDCPPSPAPPDTQQYLFCRRDAPEDGVDPGNVFTIENVFLNTYTVQVEELS